MTVFFLVWGGVKNPPDDEINRAAAVFAAAL